MNKILLAAATAAATTLLSLPAHAVVVVQWDFEGSTTPADLLDSATSPSVPASIGTGTASGLHAASATDWTTPSGNGSANAFSSNTWAVGDYYEFSFSSLGFAGLTVSVDQIGSSTGPRDFSLSWSANGSAFTPFANYSVLSSPSWSSSTPSAVHTYTFDLSAISALDDQAAVLIRLGNISTTAIGGGTVATAGTGRVDNFTVLATPVPEPGALALMLAGLGAIGFVARRRAA